MASITKEELRSEIAAQLEGADLNTISAKKVRQALEKKLDEDFTDRKKEIDDLITEVLNEKEGSDDEADNAEEEEEEDSEEEEKKKKKPAKKRAAAPKRAASDSEEEEASEDDDDEEEYAPKKKARGAPKKRAAKKSDSDEEDWRAAKKAPAKRGAKKGGGGGYTKQCQLSEPLAKLMGQPEMARHEVIKKMWSIIKEKNLYDPKNKQYAICDDAIFPVIGVKRFRTFGMMKYLKDHFVK